MNAQAITNARASNLARRMAAHLHRFGFCAAYTLFPGSSCGCFYHAITAVDASMYDSVASIVAQSIMKELRVKDLQEETLLRMKVTTEIAVTICNKVADDLALELEPQSV